MQLEVGRYHASIKRSFRTAGNLPDVEKHLTVWPWRWGSCSVLMLACCGLPCNHTAWYTEWRYVSGHSWGGKALHLHKWNHHFCLVQLVVGELSVLSLHVCLSLHYHHTVSIIHLIVSPNTCYSIHSLSINVCLNHHHFNICCPMLSNLCTRPCHCIRQFLRHLWVLAVHDGHCGLSDSTVL